MTQIKIYCLEDQEEANTVTTIGEGEHPIGRGDTLKCNDKRVSRNHAVIVVTETEVTFKSTHINPSFYKAANGKNIQLLKNNDSVPLYDGDQFALLADKFWFKVKMEHIENGSIDSPTQNQSTKRNNEDENCSSHKRLKNTLYDEVTIKTSKIKGLDSFLNRILPGNGTGKGIDTNSLLNNLTNITKEDYGGADRDCDNSIISGMDFTVPLTENSDTTKKDLSAEEELILCSNNLNKSSEDHTINNNSKPNGDLEQSLNSSSPSIEPFTKCEKLSEDLAEQNSKEETIGKGKNDISDDSDGSMDLAASIKTKKDFWGMATSDNIEPSKVEDDEESEATNSDDVPPTSNDAEPKARRDKCWYANTCYRKNPNHRAQFSHPGDDDYHGDLTDDRPQCQFGVACYRRNADHRKQFKHSHQPKLKKAENTKKDTQSDEDVEMGNNEDRIDSNKNGKKRKAVQKVKKHQETPEDDYDMDDPFINDGSSDDFQLSGEDSDDDTDWEDSQQVDEESEETRRLLKEANKFTKVKKKE